MKGQLPYEFMKSMYGQEIIDSLIQESRDVIKYTTSDYLELERVYRQKAEAKKERSV